MNSARRTGGHPIRCVVSVREPKCWFGLVRPGGRGHARGRYVARHFSQVWPYSCESLHLAALTPRYEGSRDLVRAGGYHPRYTPRCAGRVRGAVAAASFSDREAADVEFLFPQPQHGQSKEQVRRAFGSTCQFTGRRRAECPNQY